MYFLCGTEIPEFEYGSIIPLAMENEDKGFVFVRKNYILMLIGIAFLAIGYILMIGGGSEDPNVFNPEIFSSRRIVVAPTIILIGFAIEVYAIMYRPKQDTE